MLDMKHFPVMELSMAELVRCLAVPAMSLDLRAGGAPVAIPAIQRRPTGQPLSALMAGVVCPVIHEWLASWRTHPVTCDWARGRARAQWVRQQSSMRCGMCAPHTC